MAINYTSKGDGQYRIVADGWWADVEYKWDRATDVWRVAILDSNAYGRVALTDIALAANEAIGMGEVPREKLVWADTGGRVSNENERTMAAPDVDALVTYTSRGDGNYRIFGPGFCADVHMHWTGDRWICSVRTCNNHMINAWDIQIWCEKNIA